MLVSVWQAQYQIISVCLRWQYCIHHWANICLMVNTRVMLQCAMCVCVGKQLAISNTQIPNSIRNRLVSHFWCPKKFLIVTNSVDPTIKRKTFLHVHTLCLSLWIFCNPHFFGIQFYPTIDVFFLWEKDDAHWQVSSNDKFETVSDLSNNCLLYI